MAPKRKSTEQGEDSGKKAKQASGTLQEGDTCPDFTVIDQESNDITLSEIVRDKGAVIFVYPKANTPGCTKQAIGFRDEYEDLTRAGYQVFGLSADNPTPQSNWKKKHELPFSLLCDRSKTALNALGFLVGDKIKRGHIVVGKGRIVQQYSLGVTPAKSVAGAHEFCIAKGREGDEEEGAGETG